MLQQHQIVSRKRSSDETMNGCSEKKEKLHATTERAETTTAKPDKEDGIGMSVEIRTVEELHSKYPEDQGRKILPCCIQSFLRKDLRLKPREADGNILKVHREHGKSPKTMTADFTGTSQNDKLTSFLIERDLDTDHQIFRYCSGEDNYYLAVRKAQPDVIFRKLKNFSGNVKYLFRVGAVNINEEYYTIQSVKNDEYLYCGEDGKVSMKGAGEKMSNGVPEDRAMWFSFLNEPVHIQHQAMLFAEMDCWSVPRNDYEDTGKKQTTDPEKGPADDSEKGAPKGPEEQHIKDTNQGKRDGRKGLEDGDLDQGKLEHLAGGNSEGLKDVCDEDQREEDSKESEEGNSGKPKPEGNSKRSSQGNSEEAEEDNSVNTKKLTSV